MDLVTPPLGRQTQADPWGSLTSQPQLFVKFQESERLCLRNNKVGAEEMAVAKTCTDFSEDPSYVPNTCIRWFTTAYKFSSRRSESPLSSPQSPALTRARIHAYHSGNVYTHI